jgi:hypothetical protein
MLSQGFSKEGTMKRLVIISSLIFICLTAPVFGQTVCEFNIIGTWKATSINGVSSVIYRFEPDGAVTMRSLPGSGQGSESKEIARGTYKLDNAKSPKSILFTINTELVGPEDGTTSVKIIKYDDTSFTTGSNDHDTLEWERMDSNRYFLVLAGRKGVFYDRSGPTFPILIKTDGRETQIDAMGIYSVGGRPFFGPIPAELRDEFMKESRNASDVMLRLEIGAPQYERGLKVLWTWDRRAKEGNLLYPNIFMDNVLLVKQVTETLNQCGTTVKLYRMDWGPYDYISNNSRPSLGPFLYFKELKRLNESLHIPDVRFQEIIHPVARQARR